MSEQSQTEHAGRLVARIEGEAAAECDRLLDAARAEARTLHAAARAKAREKLQAEVDELRRNGTQALARMQSRIENELRQLRQRQGAKAQDRGLARLCAAMDALWKEKPAREGWASAALAEARANLLPGMWEVSHAKGLTASEAKALAREIETHCGHTPSLTAAGEIGSGFVIRAHGAALDATGAGLCRDSTRLRALFQSELEAMRDEIREEAP